MHPEQTRHHCPRPRCRAGRARDAEERPDRLARWVARAAIAVLALGLCACASAPPRNPLAVWAGSPNHGERKAQLIVLHYTASASVPEALAILQSGNAEGPVSAHYLIGADGRRYQLVADSQRAWHAGAGRWGTITDVNSASIGIELDNDGRTPFTSIQIASLIELLRDLTERLRIPPTQIIGHEDLAPGRKRDPGPLFPWRLLADAGFGRWPVAPLVDPPVGFDAWAALAAVGYPLDPPAAALQAFHHHFRGLEGDEFDAEDLRILYALSRPLPVSAPAIGPVIGP